MQKREPYNPLLKSYPDSERVNAVSIGAETLFTRLIAQSDDHAHYYGDPGMIAAKLFTIRMCKGEVSAKNISAWVDELKRAGLVDTYEVDGKPYLEIRNCIKRLRKDVSLDLRFPSRNRNGPGPDSGRDRSDSGPPTQPNPTQPNPTEECSEPAPPTSLPPFDPIVFTFPTIRGRKSKDETWDLTASKVAEFSETFPAVDVVGQCRKALQWVKASNGRRKTAGGMEGFLFRWLGKEQDRGGGGGAPVLVGAVADFRNPTEDELQAYREAGAE